MKWVPVESSVFTAFSYIRREHVLYLKFRSGDVYRYFDFPPDRFGDFVAAESKGRYFAHYIRDRFPFEPVRRSSADDDDREGPKGKIGRPRCRPRSRPSDRP